MSKRELLDEDMVVFDSPEYDDAIIGTTHDGRVVYDFDKMCEELHEKDGMSIEEAIEFIEYNAIRAIPYAGYKAPVVMYPLYDE